MHFFLTLLKINTLTDRIILAKITFGIIYFHLLDCAENALTEFWFAFSSVWVQCFLGDIPPRRAVVRPCVENLQTRPFFGGEKEEKNSRLGVLCR